MTSAMHHNRTAEDAVAYAIEGGCALTHAYAANDPEIRELARVAVDAVRRWDLEHRENLPDAVYEALEANSRAITAGIRRMLELEAEIKRLKGQP